MELKQLIYFVTTIDEGSFTKASEKLFVSQPAISKMVLKLESEIGTKLLIRQQSSVEPTEVGQIVYEKAVKLINHFDDVTHYLKNVSKSEEGRLVIGLPSVIGTSIISSILPGFNERYPLISLKLVEEGAKIIKEKVLSGKIDIGIVILPVEEAEAKTIPLIKGGISLVVHKSHKFANYSTIKMKDLANEKFLLLEDSFQLHHNTIKACENAGFTPKIGIKSVNWDLLLELVGLKQGVSIMPTPIIRKFNSDKIKSVPIDDELLKWEIVFVCRKDKKLSNIEKIFIEYAKENASF